MVNTIESIIIELSICMVYVTRLIRLPVVMPPDRMNREPNQKMAVMVL